MSLVFDTSLYMNGGAGGGVSLDKIIVKSDTIPVASVKYVGAVYQYVGETNSTYTHGYIYECVESGSTYVWERIDVQPGATRGRFLALWNCATGLAESDPPSSPYPYGTGDYYIVGTVGTTNYKPSGSSYVIGTASTTVETDDVAVNDTYYYDGINWNLQKNTATTYTAGTGIDITNDAISVTSPTLTNTATGSNSLTILGTPASNSSSINIGVNSSVGRVNCVVIGNEATSADSMCTNIGNSSSTDYRSVSVGYSSQSSQDSVAIGSSARATANYTTAIGQNTRADQQNAIAIGTSAKAQAQGAIQIGGKTNTDSNTLYCGTYGYDNWKLLDLTTGKIPDARLSTNIQTTTNLVTSVSSSSTDTQYPSAKLFYDTCGDIETLINAL